MDYWKTRAEQQAAEIKTIKPRTFTLELSDADVKRIYEQTYKTGITPAQLLEGFIGDLVDGTYTHGSDEREFADRYFERCCYEFSRSDTLLEWALNDYRIDDIADALETLQYAIDDIQYYSDNPAEATEDAENVQYVKDAKAEAEAEIKAIYDEYAATVKNVQPYEAAIDAVKAYISELQNMIERGQKE